MIHRGRLTAFIDRHLLVWELGMALLAALYLAITFATDEGQGIWPALIFGLAALFILEFAVRFADSPDRRRYLRHHWLDLISSVPFVGGLRALRLLRLGSLLRAVASAEADAEQRQQLIQGVWFVAPVVLVLWFSAAGAFWSFEHGVNPAIRNFGDALYWALITAMTLGNNDLHAVTREGHVVAGVVVFVGIGLVSLTSARLAAHWLRDQSHHHPRVAVEKLTGLEGEIAHIKELLLAHHEHHVRETQTDADVAAAGEDGLEPFEVISGR